MAKKTVVTGHRAIDRKLATLELKIQKKIARTALRKAGKLVQGKAKQNLTANKNVITGELKRGVKVRASKRSRSRIGIFISTTERKGKSRYPFGGAQVEFGRHGVKADPFLRPAGYGSERQVRAMVADDVKSQLRAIMGWRYYFK